MNQKTKVYCHPRNTGKMDWKSTFIARNCIICHNGVSWYDQLWIIIFYFDVCFPLKSGFSSVHLKYLLHSRGISVLYFLSFFMVKYCRYSIFFFWKCLSSYVNTFPASSPPKGGGGRIEGSRKKWKICFIFLQW